jgi:thioredoxin
MVSLQHTNYKVINMLRNRNNKLVLVVLGLFLLSAKPPEEKKPVVINQEQFAKLVADYNKEWKYLGKKPCVVDFYADWCRPCRMMEPAFAKMAEKYAGKVDFYKINVDYNKGISSAYQITGIPTLFFCSADGKLTRVSGLLSEEQITAYIEMILAKK